MISSVKNVLFSLTNWETLFIIKELFGFVIKRYTKELETSVQCLIGEVGRIQVSFLYVYIIHTHILFAYFDSTIVERIQAVLTGGDGDDHLRSDDLTIDAPCALGRNSEDFTHNVVVSK